VQVDAHNVIPCWEASLKLEYSARTIRTKIQNKLPEYLKDYPDLMSNTEGIYVYILIYMYIYIYIYMCVYTYLYVYMNILKIIQILRLKQKVYMCIY
jgi:hypothetical protein